jgi:hypothetical protein
MSVVPFHSLPAECFPFTIEAISDKTGAVVWSEIIDRASMVYIPPLKAQFDSPITIRILWPDGTVTTQGAAQ